MFVSFSLPTATPLMSWKPLAGNPWWCLILTLWQKLTVPWPLPSALSWALPASVWSSLNILYRLLKNINVLEPLSSFPPSHERHWWGRERERRIRDLPHVVCVVTLLSFATWPDWAFCLPYPVRSREHNELALLAGIFPAGTLTYQGGAK